MGFWLNGTDTDTSTGTTPVFTFPDTGIYTVKLVVNRGELCTDSATTQMNVYPGFFPGFSAEGSCVLNPVQFTDTTKTRYGMISSWRWNFGDGTTNSDSSIIQNPSWKYSDTGIKNVHFIVSNSKGCLDSVAQAVHLMDKPPIIFPFRDTLICSIDTLQLHALGFGNFTWSPAGNMINPDTPDPLVYPKTTTCYTATLNNRVA